MTDDSKIALYVKEQLSAGYSEQEIRDALSDQGWHPEEIDRAFSAARTPVPQKQAPAKMTVAAEQKPEKKPRLPRTGTSTLLSLAGGVLIILNSVLVFSGIGDLLDFFVYGISLSVIGMFNITFESIDFILVNIIIGGFLVAASYVIHTMPDKTRLTGVFVVALSSIAVLIGNGFLIGGIIAVVGGAFAVLER